MTASDPHYPWLALSCGVGLALLATGSGAGQEGLSPISRADRIARAVAALEEPPRVARRAILELGTIGAPALPALFAKFEVNKGRSSETGRENATRALLAIGVETVVADYLPRALDAARRDRCCPSPLFSGVESLAASRDAHAQHPDLCRHLMALVDTHDPERLDEAVAELVRRHPSARPEMLAAEAQTFADLVEAMVIDALGRAAPWVRDPDQRHDIVAFLTRRASRLEESWRPVRVADGLARYGRDARSAIPMLVDLLAMRVEDRPAWAASGCFGTPLHGVTWVHDAAARALADVGLSRAAALALSPLQESGHGFLRDRAATALLKHVDQASLPLGPNNLLRVETADGITDTGLRVGTVFDRTFADLLELRGHEDPSSAAEVLRTLLPLSSDELREKAGTLLTKTLESEHSLVRTNGALLLAGLGRHALAAHTILHRRLLLPVYERGPTDGKELDHVLNALALAWHALGMEPGGSEHLAELRRIEPGASDEELAQLAREVYGTVRYRLLCTALDRGSGPLGDAERAAAARALGERGDRWARPYLIRALHVGQAPAVRREVLLALGRIETCRDALPALLENITLPFFVSDSGFACHVEAHHHTVTALRRLAPRLTDEARVAASHALESLRIHPEAGPRLRASIEQARHALGATSVRSRDR